MNKFTTGMLVGGAAAIMGVGYLMQDKKTYRKMMKKGKKMAVKAEEVMDDMIDNFQKISRKTLHRKRTSLPAVLFPFS